MVLASLCDVLEFLGRELLAPILTGVTAGLFVAFSNRWSAAREEVDRHETRVAELNQDFRRWVPDRDRVLEQRLRGLHRNQYEEEMRFALHNYRDEALRKVREFVQMAEREGWLHERRRRKLGLAEPALKLSDQSRGIVSNWRVGPLHWGVTGIRVRDDPTQREPAIAPLETPEGLTWSAAANHGKVRSDN